MPLNTIEKQIADKHLKRYLENLKFKPDGYYQINQQILNEIKKFKKEYSLHGYYLEQKYILGKTPKQIQKDIGYAKSQAYIIQADALTLFTTYMNQKTLELMFKSFTKHKSKDYSINQKN